MRRLPVDAGWVRRMIRLADGPWTQDALEQAFVEYGWVRRTHDGPVPYEWPGSYLFGDGGVPSWRLSEYRRPGWRLDLGWPPDGVATGHVQLLCTVLWRQHGDHRDGEYPEPWIRVPDASPTHWALEHRRLEGLVRDELGAPVHVEPPDEYGHGVTVWRRGERAVVLRRVGVTRRSPSEAIFLTVCPMESPLTTIDRSDRPAPRPTVPAARVVHTLPIDREWVRRMIRLTEVPWSTESVGQVLVDHGWAASDEGEAAVEWCAGPCSPHYFSAAPAGADTWSLARRPSLDRRLELGCPPGGDHDGEQYVQLLCGLIWPAFGEDPDPDDEYPDDSEFGEDWTTRHDASRADWDAEYDRLAVLLRAELGEPDRVTPPDETGHQEQTWHRVEVAIDLLTIDDVNSYSFYDCLLIKVRRRRPAPGE
ncbi:MAG: hypothetical protein ACRDT6_09095 [Micromonosporaceae bacterium]